MRAEKYELTDSSSWVDFCDQDTTTPVSEGTHRRRGGCGVKVTWDAGASWKVLSEKKDFEAERLHFDGNALYAKGADDALHVLPLEVLEASR